MPGRTEQQQRIDAAAALDDPALARVELVFRSEPDFVALVRKSVREGIDDVIDGRRTRRFAYSELSSPEKSYCGIRIESALVRNLELPLGTLLDISVDGTDVDVKVSSTGNWMIGPAQLNELLLLVAFSERRHRFSAGLVRGHADFMNPSQNRDAKRSLVGYAKRHISWLADDADLPVSILASLPPGAFEQIVAERARADRLRLFLSLIDDYVPFPRSVIETVVGGDDPLRGTRHDAARTAGAHPLGSFRILSYQRNRVVEALGLPRLAKGEHMKVPASAVAHLGVA